MPVNVTPNLSLNNVVTNTEQGTWGPYYEDNIDYLDDYIAGILSKDVAGTGNLILTAAEARHRALDLTGTLSGARNVIVPTAQREYVVYNSTSGAFRLTVKTSAGSGVEVPQGDIMRLWCDGTDVVLRDRLIGTDIQAFDQDLQDIADISPSQGDILYRSGSAWTRLAAGTSGQVLQTLGAGANPQWADAGKTIQRARTETGAVATTSGVIPLDDTPPQITEGGQILSLTITPKSSTSTLVLRANLNWSVNAVTSLMGAIFITGTNDALCSFVQLCAVSTGQYNNSAEYHYDNTDTNSKTFTVRVGTTQGSNTITINGAGGTRRHGGVLISSLSIDEIAD